MSRSSMLELQQVLGLDGYLKLDKLQTIAKSHCYWFTADSRYVHDISPLPHYVCSIGSSKNFYTTKLVLEKECLIPHDYRPHVIWHREWACSNVLYFIWYLKGIYKHALNMGDRDLIDILQKEFGDDIEKDSKYFTNAIDEAIRLCLENGIVDGEYVAWLLEFKKKHFGFDGPCELPVL